MVNNISKLKKEDFLKLYNNAIEKIKNFNEEDLLEIFFGFDGLKSSGRNRTREIVRIRDKHTCQICGAIWKGGRKFDVHHIDCDKRKTKQYDNLDKEKNNMITLCHKCHCNVHYMVKNPLI